MNTLKHHGPIFLLLLTVVLIAFGDLTRTPLVDELDAQIIRDAHALGQDPAPMFNHIGFYFSQPLLQLAFLGEYKLFGTELRGYIATNLVLHAWNAFLVYMLVHMLFARRSMALLAAVLFAFGVGSYGRVFMTLHQLEGLLLGGLHLQVLYLFIRNDFRNEGRILAPLFLAGLALFVASGLTRTASFSLIGCLVAYKAFFYQRRRRAILSPDILVFFAVFVLFYLGQHHWGYRDPAVFGSGADQHYFSMMSFKNIFRYLNLMFFPMQRSPFLEAAPTWIVWVYHARVGIRIFLTMSIISYSFFGFVFGSRAVRFFIAWTYITLAPFTAHSGSGVWLNLSHLYLTSLGFCVILAAGAHGCSGLLARSGWKRLLPYLAPMAFAAVSIGLSQTLDAKNKVRARHRSAVEMRAEVEEFCRSTAPDEPESGVRPDAD